MGGGKQYCCVTDCHNHKGTVVNGKSVTLHRFPSGPGADKRKLRRIWKFRVSRKSFSVKPWTRICSQHFMNGEGPTEENNIPSIFPHKTYRTSSLLTASSEHSEAEITSLVGSSYEEGASFIHDTSLSRLDVSVSLHDYMGQVDTGTMSTHRHQEVQHIPSTCTVGTQTDDVCIKQSAHELVQTDDICKTKNVHVQTDTVPDLTIYDVADKEMMFFTGLPDKATFDIVFDELTGDESEKSPWGRPRKLSLTDEFFMVLMRLRLGLLELDLAKRFKVSQSTVSGIFSSWIDRMYSKLNFLVWWTPRDVVRANMPKSFKERYPSTRVIIDCTEIFTETPASLINKTLLYSDYKSHNTWKVLVGISPNGVITFVSDLWGGNTSDKQIVVRSNLLDKCDAIMADKGFMIHDLVIERGIHLIIPPKKKAKQQFSSREVETTRRIANLRIHVERAMERIKNFRILQGVVPLSMSDQINKVFKVCCFLCNLQPPLINK